MISEIQEKLDVLNVSLKDHIKELEERLDETNNQLQGKEKVYAQEKENLLLEITALKNKLSSTSAELKIRVSKNNELAGILESSKGRF